MEVVGSGQVYSVDAFSVDSLVHEATKKFTLVDFVLSGHEGNADDEHEYRNDGGSDNCFHSLFVLSKIYIQSKLEQVKEFQQLIC